MSTRRHIAKYLGLALMGVGAIFLALTFNLLWAALELKYGPLFPEWFYYLINLKF